MDLPNYTVPNEDVDLLACGVTLTEERLSEIRVFNATRSSVVVARRAVVAQKPPEQRRKIGVSDRGKISHVCGLLRSLPGTDPYAYFSSGDAARRLDRLRERWGDAELERIMLMVRTRV